MILMHLLIVRKEPEIYVDDSDFILEIIPEKKLVRAIVGRAVCDVIVHTKEPDKKRHKREAAAWIFSSKIEPWTFLWCCEIAELDPWIIRKQATNSLKKKK